MTNEMRCATYARDEHGCVWRLTRVFGLAFCEMAGREGWVPMTRAGQPRAVRLRLGVGSRCYWPLPSEPVNVVALPRDRTALLMRALSGLGGVARRHSAAAFAGYTEVFSRRCPACGWWARRAVDDGSCRVCDANMTCEVAS